MDYKVDVNGVVNTYHANMIKQYVERQTMASHCLLSAESFASEEDDSLDRCVFPMARQTES